MKKGKIFLVSSLVFFGTLVGTTLSSCGDSTDQTTETKFTVTLNFDSTKGTVTASETSGSVGDKVTLTITPKENYEVDTIKINGTSVENTTREFEPKEGTNTVEVTFKEVSTPVETGTVTLVQGEHGTISASKTSGNVGDEITITVTPDSGYELDYLKHNNIDITSTKKFNLVKGENKVTVAFKIVQVPVETGTVILTQAEHGTISASKTSGNVGDEVIITVTPDEGYELEWLKHNDVDITDSKKFNLVKGENKVTVLFKKSIVPEENKQTIYFKDSKWWNDSAASTSIILYDEEKNIITTAIDTTNYLGESMNYLDNPGYYQECNYWSYEVDLNEVYYVQFVRTSSDGTTDWGARTDILAISKENNFATLSDEAKWSGDGNYAQVTWSKIELTDITRDLCEVNFTYDDTKGEVKLNGLAFADSTISFTITPNEGYVVDTIKINGEVVDSTTRTIDTVKGETYEIEVTFKEGTVEKYTLYFKTISELEEWGPGAFAYMFNSNDGSNSASWPGEAMTKVSYDEATNTTIWKIEGVDPSLYDTIIFSIGWSDNIVGQTQDLKFSDFVGKENNFYILNNTVINNKVYAGEWSTYNN